MFRTARARLRPAEAGALLPRPSLTHARPRASPAFIFTSSPNARLLSTVNTASRTSASYTPFKIPSARLPIRYFSSTANMASTRTESDAFGEIQVPSDRYWGAQTERSLENFRINQPQDRMPPPIVRAFGVLKGAAATVNMKYGLGTLNRTASFYPD